MAGGGWGAGWASAASAYFSDLQEPSLPSWQVAYLSNLGIVHDLCTVIDTVPVAKNKMLPHGMGVIWTQSSKFAETE